MDEDRKNAATNGKRTPLAVAAALIGVNRDTKPTYGVYQTTEISPDGAFLRGPMLLEPDEQVTVELTFEDGTRVRVHATVDRVDRGPEPGLDVRFTEMSKPARAFLRALVDIDA